MLRNGFMLPRNLDCNCLNFCSTAMELRYFVVMRLRSRYIIVYHAKVVIRESRIFEYFNLETNRDIGHYQEISGILSIGRQLVINDIKQSSLDENTMLRIHFI